MASLKVRAFPAMIWGMGPPWMPGKMALSIFEANSPLQRIFPPRAPLMVFVVVKVTKWAWGTGLG